MIIRDFFLEHLVDDDADDFDAFLFKQRLVEADFVNRFADAALRNTDRTLGLADVSKVACCRAITRISEQLEISFNKTKFNSLPPKLKAIIEGAVEACSQDMMWKAIDRNSQVYITLQTTDKVKFYEDADSILSAQLDLYDEITRKYMGTNPLFKEIIASQLAFAKRATQWEQDYITPRKMAFDHYFGPKGKLPI